MGEVYTEVSSGTDGGKGWTDMSVEGELRLVLCIVHGLQVKVRLPGSVLALPLISNGQSFWYRRVTTEPWKHTYYK